ncbi:hypothetical protein N9W57_04530 [Pseudomonadales bacterium]|nr:hypothetical protein [Pseudomonadales bacterium]
MFKVIKLNKSILLASLYFLIVQSSVAHEAIMLRCTNGLQEELKNNEVALKEISLFTGIHWGENTQSQSFSKLSSNHYSWMLDADGVTLGIATTLSTADEISSGPTIIFNNINPDTLEGIQWLSMLRGKNQLDKSYKPKPENIKPIICSKVSRGKM